LIFFESSKLGIKTRNYMIWIAVEMGKFLTVKPVYEHFTYLWYMGVMHTFFSGYIRASFHVSLALISALFITVERYRLNLPVAYFGVLFFGGLAAYNVIKNLVEPGTGKGSLVLRFGWELRMSFFAAILAIFCLLLLDIQYLLGLALTGILVVLYAVPIFPRLQNFRNYGLIKIVLVGAVWTSLTFLVPMCISDIPYHTDSVMGGIQRMLWMLLLMLPFEMRDIQIDAPQIKTLPRRLGFAGTKRIGWFGAGLLFFIGLYANPNSPQMLMVDGIIAVLTGLAIKFSNPNQGPYYASFWVESIPIAVAALQFTLSRIMG
jgi:hypothetical protein